MQWLCLSVNTKSLCSPFLQPGTHWELFLSIELYQLLYLMLDSLCLLVALCSGRRALTRGRDAVLPVLKGRAQPFFCEEPIKHDFSPCRYCPKVQLNWQFSWFQKPQQIQGCNYLYFSRGTTQFQTYNLHENSNCKAVLSTSSLWQYELHVIPVYTAICIKVCGCPPVGI